MKEKQIVIALKIREIKNKKALSLSYLLTFILRVEEFGYSQHSFEKKWTYLYLFCSTVDQWFKNTIMMFKTYLQDLYKIKAAQIPAQIGEVEELTMSHF